MSRTPRRTPRQLRDEGRYPPPRRRRTVTEHERGLVRQAAAIHRAQGCGPHCPLRRADAGDEAALAEVMADATRRALERA